MLSVDDKGADYPATILILGYACAADGMADTWGNLEDWFEEGTGVERCLSFGCEGRKKEGGGKEEEMVDPIKALMACGVENVVHALELDYSGFDLGDFEKR